MTSKNKRLECSDYHVAWICPLADVELPAARLMLDEEHDVPQFDTHYDENTYICGEINGHTVVVATCVLGETGNVNAGRLTGSMFKTFPNIRMAVLVGIGGGIPQSNISDDPLENIHLGDVIVGWPGDGKPACVYHDRGKSKVNGQHEMVGTMQDPDYRLTNALSVLISDHDMGQTKFRDHLARLQRLNKFAKKFAHPGLENDTLFRAAYHHNGADRSSCTTCNSNEILERPRRTEEHKKDLVFHRGRIATGNSVIRDGVRRDQIGARCDGALCVEMEAAGVDVNRRCLVIRGISDYADSHKSDLWQYHAAGNAAAFTRELLCRIQPGIIRKMEGVKVEDVKEGSSFFANVQITYLCNGVIPVIDFMHNVLMKGTVGPWLVPFVRPESFVGRKNELTQLSEHISSDGGHRLAVYGLGGCGKTALALEMAYRTREEQPTRAIFWVPAVSRERFEQAYREIGTLLRIPGIETDKADVKQLVKAALSDDSFGNWLMIIDNADDTNVLFDSLGQGNDSKRLIDFLPHSRRGSIVFTTRTREAGIKLAKKHIQLDKLDEQEAKKVLRKTLLQNDLLEDDKLVDEFLGILTFLPLAIIQAVAFVNVNEISLSEYIDMFRSSERDATDLFSEEFEDQARYRDTNNAVATTWYISFEQIRQKNELAADYLSFMACTTGESVPKSLLPPVNSEVEHTRATGMLKAYAFIRRRSQNDQFHESQKGVEIFDVHALVHLATRNWLRNKNEWPDWVHKTLTRLVNVVPFAPEDSTANRRVWSAYLPHASHIVDFPEIYETEARMSLLGRIGHCEKTIGHYKAAVLAYQQLLEQKQKVLKKENPEILRITNDLAMALAYQGSYTKAEEIFQDIISLIRVENEITAIPGGMEDLLLTAMKNAAGIRRFQEDYAEAERILREILENEEKILPREDSQILRTMNELAIVIGYQGNYAKAEEIHREILVIKEKALGKEHPDTLMTMSNLAYELFNQGSYTMAEKMCREVLALSEKVVGKEHSNRLGTMNGLALFLAKRGNYTKSEEINREILVLCEKELGKDHPHTLPVMNNLAEVLSSQESYAKAEEILQETLALHKKVLGKEHPDTLATMHQLAGVLADQQSYVEADEIFRETLALREKVLGKEHPGTLTTKACLAGTLTRQQIYAKSEEIYRETLALSEKKVLGKEHPVTLSTQGHLKKTVARQRQRKPKQRRFINKHPRSKPIALGSRKLGRVFNAKGEGKLIQRRLQNNHTENLSSQ